MATRTAIVEGDRNVLITAPTNNALIVTGDRNTVEMTLEGAGAALAFAFRWNRPKPRKRGDRPAPPARFERHVDREAEVLALAPGDDPPRVVNLYGAAGIGKTHVLVEALTAASARCATAPSTSTAAPATPRICCTPCSTRCSRRASRCATCRSSAT